ncbi:hypothetical protein MIND_00629400 [Mycena indigotica]|uniref:Uncharacterized protein n=1 Tax=Mycena indigotica TaxID=2126181 RepID=A0A8H6W9C4_9AGAR|nr:uncharacterized protein MIND_00629400 [Mycena indigotica]KAF7303984.1 hypothetical protein MIND_00629400 [Mycena indigotica]
MQILHFFRPMFPPFTSYTQFYAGLIVWCDPSSYDAEISTLPTGEEYDRRTARAPKPCLVVAVDHEQGMLQVARMNASTPRDTRKWVRLDSPPAITWRVSDGWIWVGKPGMTKMILNDSRLMHPHRDTSFSINPIAAANLQSYWTHRQNYLRWRQLSSDPVAPPLSGTSSPAPSSYHDAPAAPGTFTTLYATSGPNTSVYGNPHSAPNAVSYYNTLSTQPVVVPSGFTERHSNFPGVWRNPSTGWFWSASRGLMPPPTSS